jgi:hypothetical protein
MTILLQLSYILVKMRKQSMVRETTCFGIICVKTITKTKN